jgi:hypothetical protein
MAYPTIDKPYGFKPVSLIGGRPFAGSTRAIPITTAEGTAIYYGDVVLMTNAGTLTKASATDSATLAVGIFLGCEYTSAATGTKVWSQYFPAATAAPDIVGHVCDDPDTVFKVAVCTAGGTTMNGLTRAAVGQTAAFANVGAGVAASGNSLMAISATTGTVTTFPVKIIDLVEETRNASGSYTEVLVTWNGAVHFYRSNAGV